MLLNLQYMIQDPDISALKTKRMVEGWEGLDEVHYLDGPVTPRVAVVDLDPSTEELVPGAVFQPPPRGKKTAKYVVDTSTLFATEIFGF